MQTSMNSVLLPGLDGSNPLAFLAALGVVRAMTASRPNARPALHWDGSSYRATLRLLDDEPCDLRSIGDGCATVFRRVISEDFSMGSYAATTFGLTNAQLRKLTRTWLSVAAEPTRRDVCIPLLAGANVESSEPADGNAAFSEFSFANGQSGLHLLGGKKLTKKGKLQSYEGLRDLAARPDLPDLMAECMATWTYHEGFRSYRWCPTEFRPAAQQSGDTVVASVPGANALAFLGLSLLPMVSTVSGAASTAFIARRDFVYPLWSVPLPADVIQSMLSHPTLFRDALPSERSAVGLIALLAASRFVHEKGVYFTYAKAV